MEGPPPGGPSLFGLGVGFSASRPRRSPSITSSICTRIRSGPPTLDAFVGADEAMPCLWRCCGQRLRSGGWRPARRPRGAGTERCNNGEAEKQAHENLPGFRATASKGEGRLRDTQAARSATTESSTSQPSRVARRRPSPARSTKPCSRRKASRAGAEAAPAHLAIARRLDAFAQPQAHQQHLVGRFLQRQQLVGDEAVAVAPRPSPASLRVPLGHRGAAAAVEREPAMRAGTDADIFAVAPVDEVVAALRAGRGVVGDLVGRQAARLA